MHDARPADITIEVSKADSALRATRADGTLVFFAPVSSGSIHDPLPPGNWKVTGVAWHPVFHYNPNLFWDAKPKDEKATIKAGPNNPVGVVWIALNLEHYGLHGTPEPGNIGHTESHGCVRLTNWDAARVAALVKPGHGRHVQMSRSDIRGGDAARAARELRRRRAGRRLAADLRSAEAGGRRGEVRLTPDTSQRRVPSPRRRHARLRRAAPGRAAGAAFSGTVRLSGPTSATGDSRMARLRVPIDGEDIESFKGGFAERATAATGRTKRSTCWRRATRRCTRSRTAPSPSCSRARPAA